ncbi:hypothetical protein LMG29542_07944 [Paraburkholderia humisilvae]|uniref:Uncharacterized protein n=1 Tax=Paraburkholderia humisilvae TaxID=627669 RepID=A0A6J5FBE7_9BURK|nr:hypothetical protein LMG29542_07944 [Paraburkholderia humisilvae]
MRPHEAVVGPVGRGRSRPSGAIREADGRRIESWTDGAQRAQDGIPDYAFACIPPLARNLKTTRKPLLDKECRSGRTQSQQYLMSYIRHKYQPKMCGRQATLYDEMRE